MELKDVKKHWDKFGKDDPMWAILTDPDKRGNRWNSEDFFKHGQSEIERQLAYIKELPVHLQYEKALDFGCGVGRLSQALAVHFREVTGVDIAPSMIKLANRYNRHGSRCRYFVNDHDHLGIFSENTFDFVYSTIVLQHIRPSYAMSYIKEFLRVLKPHGLLVFQLPSQELSASAPPKPALPNVEGQQSSSFFVSVKQFAKQLTPSPILELYWNVRYRVKHPVMEMYCTKKEEVEAFLRCHGGHVLAVRQNKMLDWLSCQYYVTKTHHYI
jgi:ubiquinone/menaquinone biosynthesis C-methylase UbiE